MHQTTSAPQRFIPPLPDEILVKHLHDQVPLGKPPPSRGRVSALVAEIQSKHPPLASIPERTGPPALHESFTAYFNEPCSEDSERDMDGGDEQVPQIDMTTRQRPSRTPTGRFEAVVETTISKVEGTVPAPAPHDEATGEPQRIAQGDPAVLSERRAATDLKRPSDLSVERVIGWKKGDRPSERSKTRTSSHSSKGRSLTVRGNRNSSPTFGSNKPSSGGGCCKSFSLWFGGRHKNERQQQFSKSSEASS